MSDNPNPDPTGTGLVGQKLGQYEIRQQLGQGGMATVYLGYQPTIDRTVAVKVMPRYFLHDPTFLQRFEREVKVIARLQHPRIVPVFDYGQAEGQPYIVMAYMPAGTLTDRIRQGALPLGEVVRLVDQIAEGLDHAHREGVIHRDFKPSNVLLDKNGNAHLADFGIAKISESTAALTGSGIVGTPAYMAPEMASEGLVSPAVDVYALGVTLYQMLTGRYPYQGDTPLRVMMAHATEPVPDVLVDRPDLPPAVAAIIARAMAKDPADRFPTAGEMAQALRAAVEGRPLDASAPAARPPSATVIEAPAGGVVGQPPTPTPPPALTPSIPAPGMPSTGAFPAPAKKTGCSTPVIIGGVILGLLACAAFLALGGLAMLGLTITPTPGPTDTPVPTATLDATPTPDEPPGPDDLRIENTTPGEVCYFYLSPDSSTSWGGNRIESGPVPQGSSFMLSGIDPGLYNMKAEDCDRNVLWWFLDVELGDQFYTVQVAPSQHVLTLVNNMGDDICQVYLSLSTENTWGLSYVDSSAPIPVGGERTFAMGRGQYDLRVDTCRTDEFAEEYAFDVVNAVEWAPTGD